MTTSTPPLTNMTEGFNAVAAESSKAIDRTLQHVEDILNASPLDMNALAKALGASGPYCDLDFEIEETQDSSRVKSIVFRTCHDDMSVFPKVLDSVERTLISNRGQHGVEQYAHYATIFRPRLNDSFAKIDLKALDKTALDNAAAESMTAIKATFEAVKKRCPQPPAA